MIPRELEEYRALRATIRERGTARFWVFLVGLGIWSGLVVGTAALASLPEATLLPLLVLAGVFEAVFALHTGVERVGRYLQVFYETEEGTTGWEHAAMAFGRPDGSAVIDPLFKRLFWLAAVLNFIPAVLAGAVPVEWTVIGLAHALFIGRVVIAGRQAARQRTIDFERFRQMKLGA